MHIANKNRVKKLAKMSNHTYRPVIGTSFGMSFCPVNVLQYFAPDAANAFRSINFLKGVALGWPSATPLRKSDSLPILHIIVIMVIHYSCIVPFPEPFQQSQHSVQSK